MGFVPASNTFDSKRVVPHDSHSLKGLDGEYVEWIRCPRCNSNAIYAGLKKDRGLILKCRGCARRWEIDKDGKRVSVAINT